MAKNEKYKHTNNSTQETTSKLKTRTPPKSGVISCAPEG